MPPAGRVKHCAHSVTGVEAFAQRLHDAGGDFGWDLRVHEDVKALFLRDNTGNLVELVEPLEPADDERTPKP